MDDEEFEMSATEARVDGGALAGDRLVIRGQAYRITGFRAFGSVVFLKKEAGPTDAEFDRLSPEERKRRI
jgi:hypothetical protein